MRYCTDVLQLKNPRILIPKIKINTLFSIDGFPMHISGRTGDNVTFKVAAQLTIDDESMRYLKSVLKLTERQKNRAICERMTLCTQVLLQSEICSYMTSF